ncbi:MAG: hypothetical protein ACRBB0_27235 [Pelagimonas sp.]|uniref:hypothetical protein n=1 Tax=Pelagimonas sp. TaxID=2073170 RepID=UPI003D6BD7A4
MTKIKVNRVNKTGSNAPTLELTGTTCIWGQSESGKSHMAREMLKAADPKQCVIIDPQSPAGYDAPGVRRALADGKTRIICNDSRRDHQIGAMVFALNHSTPETPVYVVADEAPGYMDKPRDILSRMVLQGRHAGFGILIIGQRPASVYAEYRTQAKATYWMRLTDHTDMETAKKSLGPAAEELRGFKQGEYVKWPV